MLVERVFLLGGALCLVAGVLMLGALASFGAFAVDPFLATPGVLFLGFGALFVYVGVGARRERRSLLRLGEEGIPPSSR
jgi:hypothetical protein